MTTSEFEAKYGDIEVTVSVVEMAQIVRTCLRMALDACPMDNPDDLLFGVMLTDVLTAFSAQIMTEMYHIDDTLEIEGDTK